MSVSEKIRAAIGHRGRSIIRIGSWSLVAKACAAANLFISIPFVLRALDSAQFGAWATLVSLVAFSGFLDFGFGNSTMNLVAAAHGRGARSEVASIIVESRKLLLIVAGVLALALAALLLVAPWHRLLGMPETLGRLSQLAMATVFGSIVLAIPLNLGSRVQLGLGRGNRAFGWQAAGQLGALAAVVLVSHYCPSLLALTAAAVLTPLLAAIGNTVELLRDPTLRPEAASSPAERRRLRWSISREGGLFFVLQLAAALGFSADLALISALQGAVEAGTYAIVQRMFSVIPLALSLVWAPLWPIYRQALATGDLPWVTRTLRRSVIFAGGLAAICGTAIALGYAPFMHVWAPASMLASGVLVAGFAAWSVFEATGTAVATFLNSASVLRFQLATACLFAVFCLAAKAWVIVHYDVSLMPWVTVAVYCATWVVPLMLWWPRILASVRARTY